jgi:LAO/AO transport system kinase
MLPGAGDELQGIKKGIIEIADMIAINKADGDNVTRAKTAASVYRAALNIIASSSPNWSPPVVTISGKENLGLDELWNTIEKHRETLTGTGEFEERRQAQAVKWMHDMLEDRLKATLRANEKIAARLPEIETQVRSGKLTPALAVEEILRLMGTEPNK